MSENLEFTRARARLSKAKSSGTSAVADRANIHYGPVDRSVHGLRLSAAFRSRPDLYVGSAGLCLPLRPQRLHEGPVSEAHMTVVSCGLTDRLR